MFTIKYGMYTLTDHHPDLHLKVSTDGQINLNAEDFYKDFMTAKQYYFAKLATDAPMQKLAADRYNVFRFMDIVEIRIPV